MAIGSTPQGALTDDMAMIISPRQYLLIFSCIFQMIDIYIKQVLRSSVSFTGDHGARRGSPEDPEGRKTGDTGSLTR
jgi:hypothetical protein